MTYGVNVGQDFSVAAFVGGPDPFNTEGNAFAVFDEGTFQFWTNVSMGGASTLTMINQVPPPTDFGLRVTYGGGGLIVYQPSFGANPPRGTAARFDLLSTGAPVSPPPNPVPDPGTGIPGDLDGDSDVGRADLDIVISCFGRVSPLFPPCDDADVAPPPDGDGVINILDISFVGSSFTP